MPMPLTSRLAAKHQPWAGTVGRDGRPRSDCRRRHDLKHALADEAELATSPAEIVDDRPQRQADGEARSATDEQHEEAGREDEPPRSC